MPKIYIVIFVLVTLVYACSQIDNSDSDKSVSSVPTDSSLMPNRESDSVYSTDNLKDSLQADSNIGDDMMVNYFVVIADTSRNYYNLRNPLLIIAAKHGFTVDSMGRYYDAIKGIILPADCGDEMYAGEYYPRRFEGSELSIEYYSWYTSKTNHATMAVVAGQYTDEYQALRQLKKLKLVYPSAFIKEAVLYNGCMH